MDCNLANKEGYTPLHLASISSSPTPLVLIDLLLSTGQVDPNLQNKYGRTPLRKACERGNLIVAQRLLEAGADPNIICKNKESPLTISLHKQRWDLASLLLDHGADPNHPSATQSSSPLHFACRHEQVSLVGKLLEMPRIQLDPQDKDDRTPLHLLIKQCTSTDSKAFLLAKRLAERGASLSPKSLKNDQSFNQVYDDFRTRELQVSFFLSVSLPFKSLRENHASVYFHLLSLCDQVHTTLPTPPPPPPPPLLLPPSVSQSQVPTPIPPSPSPPQSKKHPKSPRMNRPLNPTPIPSPSLSASPTLPLPVSLGPAPLSPLENKALEYFQNFPLLADCKDQQERKIIDVANKRLRKRMLELTLWFGRYRLSSVLPEHMSSTSYVFRAQDEMDILPDSGLPRPVALKLMKHKTQFVREVVSRVTSKFDPKFVVEVLRTHPELPPSLPETSDLESLLMSSLPSRPDDPIPSIDSEEGPASEGSVDLNSISASTVRKSYELTKAQAESHYCLVMDLADRNLFVALKQERFAGSKDLTHVKFIFQQLIRGVQKIYSRNRIHADIKPLNVVRIGGEWKWIDLDASCEIGKGSVGFKSSSAYSPPEAVVLLSDPLLVESTSDPQPTASIRSQAHRDQHGLSYDLLVPHPSFDVWSLGCLLFQLITPEVLPLWPAGQDDNLNDHQLRSLAEWSEETKSRRLNYISDPLGRNLVSQMLFKDPSRRPTLERVLSHPFLTNRKISRLMGQEAQFDVFISYRVWSDAEHAKHLYECLREKYPRLRLWWDQQSLKDGENWMTGFCEGLINSRIFVYLFSGKGISSFSSLKESSPVDSVLLEYRLAIELRDFGLIEKLFPIVIGDPPNPETLPHPSVDPLLLEYKINWSAFSPSVPDICVSSVEEGLLSHLNNQALGTPLEPRKTVSSVLAEMKKQQGALIQGRYEDKMNEAVDRIFRLVSSPPTQPPPSDLESIV